MSLRRPTDPPAHTWRQAGRCLLAKLLAELSFEELLVPQPAGTTGNYRVELAGGVEYRFHARRDPFGGWRVDPTSPRRVYDGAEEPADDPLRFALDARHALALSGPVMGELVRELAATQAADARLLATSLSAAELADLPYAELEGYQSGHPCMVLNKGRLGFSGRDLQRYAPEARHPLRLPWIAVHRDLASYQAMAGLDHHQLLAQELDPHTRRTFAATLTAQGCDRVNSYLWMPVHPWHLDEAVLPLFAPDLAERRIVLLGKAPDRYLPLQSIRTLTNLDTPRRRNVKLPLLIRNTLVWRGLSPHATAAAPQVTAWLQGIRQRDPFLRDDCRVVLLGEVASVAVRHTVLEAIPDAPYRYHELLGVVWRQPVESFLQPGERARTMAALLAVDPAGRSLVAELVARSGLDPCAWLRRLFAALLPPLLHYLCKYGVSFCPHGENTVILYDDHDVPVRVAVKDFAEDVNLTADPLPEQGGLPAEADAVLLRWEPSQLCHSILSAVFVGHFRFLADLVAAQFDLPEDAFWALVRAEVLAYRQRFPQLAERFATFDLLAPTFERVCLNREQLLGGGFHDRPERDAEFDLLYGRATNPLCTPDR